MELVTSTPKAYSADETRQIQNCIALLTRLVPAGFEQFALPDQLDSFEQQVFWASEANYSSGGTVDSNESVPRDDSAINSSTDGQETAPQPPSDTVAINSSDVQPDQPPTNNGNAGSNSAPRDALAPRILSLGTKLLFLPHFTVAPDSYPIWYSGVGVPADAKISNTTAAMATNRVLTLQLLLAVLSHNLFLSPALYFKRRMRNAWMDYFTNPPRDSTIYGHIPHVLHSLLNTAQRYDPVGWGVPYNHLLFGDQQEELLYKAMQLLALALNYSADSWTEDDAPFTEQQAEAADTSSDNLFLAALREITDRASFDQWYGMFAALFGNPLRANHTYLPNSAKELNCHPELLILFWALIRNHPVSRYILLWTRVLTCQI